MTRGGRSVAILGFHKIGEPPEGVRSWFYIPEATFAAQLEHLHRARWPVIDLATFLRGLADPPLLPERSALLSFDDGYRSIRAGALSTLRRFGHPAVLFVPTDHVGGRNTFDAGVEPDEAICDWDDLRALEQAGVAVQSHGASHRRFSELGPEERERELGASKAVLEARLGRRVDTLAFPYGDDGGEGGGIEQALRRAGYRAAFRYGGGPLGLPAPDVFRMPRLAMGPDTALEAVLPA